MSQVFVIDHRDNVATALEALGASESVAVLGECALVEIQATENIRAEHKIALAAIAEGADIIKYGMPIGYASKRIEAGEWVHLHNCASHYDERSNTLDGDSGAPTDTEYV